MFGKLFVVAALVACAFAAPKPSVVNTETIATAPAIAAAPAITTYAAAPAITTYAAAPAIATYAAAPAIATSYAAAPIYNAGYSTGLGLGAGLAAQTYHAAPLAYHAGFGYGSYY